MVISILYKHAVKCALLAPLFLASVIVAAKGPKENYSREMLQTVSSYTKPGIDNTTSFLEQLGYRPAAQDEARWKKLPAVRKFEIAYRAAQDRSKNGQAFLAAMASAVTENFRGGADNKSKHRRPRKIRFSKKPENELAYVAVDNETKMAILRIAHYTDRGALGGTQSVLQRYFHESELTTYNLLATSDDDYHALLSASEDILTRNSDINKPLSDISRGLQYAYASACSNEDLKKYYLSKEKVIMPKGMPVFGKAAIMRSSIKFKQYIKSDSLPVARSFENMMTNPEKWGGIVFGNSVTADTASVKQQPRAVYWLPDAKRRGEPVSGTLEILTANSLVPLTTRTVFLEDVYAAYELLYADDTLVPHIQKGEGAGLVNAIGHYKSQFDIDINPAIANFELGRCLARADVWPAINDWIKLIMDTTTLTPSQKSIIDSLVKVSYGRGWKFSDAPMQVQVKDGFLEAVATGIGVDPDYPLCFFYYNAAQHKYTSYHAVVPVLCNAFYDYDRMCSFAKTFAILRWAKENGASFINSPQLPQMTAAPSKVMPIIEHRQLYVD